jgi:hypothetical protein
MSMPDPAIIAMGASTIPATYALPSVSLPLTIPYPMGIAPTLDLTPLGEMLQHDKISPGRFAGRYCDPREPVKSASECELFGRPRS